MNIKLFEEIEQILSSSRVGLIKTDLGEDDENIRSAEDAKQVLNTLKQVCQYTISLLDEHPYLETLFTNEFGELKQFSDRETIIETCFLDFFIFPEAEQYPIMLDGELNFELIKSYEEIFNNWCTDKAEAHLANQLYIKENFDKNIKQQEMGCVCIQCVADYRAKLRDVVLQDQIDLIDLQEERFHEFALEGSLEKLTAHVQKLKKRLDKNNNTFRYRLKRSSLNKLEYEVKNYFQEKFKSDSAAGKVVKEKLKANFNALLIEQELKPEIISEEEYARFFNQLGIGIYKSPNFLKKDFLKMVQTVLSFKRKDISSTILKDYLGQFWLHAKARMKTRKIIYHMGPTNSGKTYHAIEALCASKKGCYLAPLRLLASELYDTMNSKGVKTTLLTGEEVIELEGATHYSSTIEMAKLHEDFECCVIDEIQMITDSQRGWAWTRALINLNSDEIHICGDPSVLELVEKILKLTGDTIEVRNYERMTKLEIEKNQITIGELKKSDALIVFSRRNALKFKSDLENLNFKVSIIYGRLSPEVRREQARKFDEGETDIMVSTDAIAMGMNLPVKRIVFSTLSKFINSKEHPITNSEIKQIAGRAGRFKRFPTGYANALQAVDEGTDRIEEALGSELEQQEMAMVGPDLEIYNSVNFALEEHSLPKLSLSEFLRLFNTMIFEKPFYCVELKEMIEVTEMIENADVDGVLSSGEVFGFACAPVNLGLVEHVQFFIWILNHYVKDHPINNEEIDTDSDNIDYLETSIKCVELYQWLSRHFDGKNFEYIEKDLLENKSFAVEKLNELLSEKIAKRCSSCGCKLETNSKFNICEKCFDQRKSMRRRRPNMKNKNSSGDKKNSGGSRNYSKKQKSSKRPKKKNKAAAFKKHR